MKLKLLYIVRTLAFVILIPMGSLSAQAAPEITPEQMQMFQKLPPEQQKALADEYGISLSQIGQSDMSGTFPKAVLPEKRNQQVDLSSNYLKLRKQLELQKLEDEETQEEDELKRFGLGVFSTKPNTFAPISNLPVPNDYILGPGDSILVQLFGKENQSLQFKVNRQGTILFPELGPVSVAGQSFLSVKNAIMERIAEQKIGVRAAVSMGELRSIEVFVSGDSYQPGKYLVSSLATITHALYASGGVSESGSLRDIRLIRNGNTIKSLDLYDLLIHGNSANDVRLHAGDVIFVSPLGATAKVEGEVVRSAIYEIKGDETIGTLIFYAGGTSDKAYLGSVNLERYTKEGFISLTTLDLLDNRNTDQLIRNGDSIVINPILKSDLRFVSVKGNAARPGKYQWRENLRISDIFPSIKGRLNKSSDLNYSIIVRTFNSRNDVTVLQFDLGNAILNPHSIDDLVLQPQDEILVFTRYDLETFTKDFAVKESQDDLLTILDAGQRSKLERIELNNNEEIQGKEPEIDFEKASLMTGLTKEEIELALASTRKKLLTPLLMILHEQSAFGEQVKTAEVLGEVRFPGIYPITDRETVKDLIVAAGGLNDAAYMLHSELIRTSVANYNAKTELLRIDLAKAMGNSSSQNIRIAPMDRLNVLAIPNIRKQRTVSLQGEVKFPGTYVLERGETLGDLLKRAGGLSAYAHIDGAVFTREALRLREQEKIDSYAESIRQEVAKKSLRKDNGSLGSSATEQLELIEQMSGSVALGRMVIDLPAIVDGDISKDFILEDQDLLFVPQFRNSITIMGEVQLSTSYLLDRKLTYKDYINQAGGIKKQADEDRIFIVRANGSVYKPESGFWFGNKMNPLEPGDTIIVPIDSDYRDTLTTWGAVTQIMYQIGVAANAFN